MQVDLLLYRCWRGMGSAMSRILLIWNICWVGTLFEAHVIQLYMVFISIEMDGCSSNSNCMWIMCITTNARLNYTTLFTLKQDYHTNNLVKVNTNIGCEWTEWHYIIIGCSPQTPLLMFAIYFCFFFWDICIHIIYKQLKTPMRLEHMGWCHQSLTPTQNQPSTLILGLSWYKSFKKIQS